MALSIWGEDATNGKHLNQAHLLHTQARGSHAIYKQMENNRARDGDKDTSRTKALRPTMSYSLRELKRFYLVRLAPQTHIQKPKEITGRA